MLVFSNPKNPLTISDEDCLSFQYDNPVCSLGEIHHSTENNEATEIAFVDQKFSTLTLLKEYKVSPANNLAGLKNWGPGI